MDTGSGSDQSVLYADLQKYLKSPHLNRSTPLKEDDPNVAVTRDVLTALVKECFENIPRAGISQWYPDVALMAQTALELFSKALVSLGGVYRGAERAWLLSLLSFAGLMEGWSLYDPGLDADAEAPTPRRLREQALEVTRRMLSAIRRDFVFLPDEETQTWQVVKDLESELVSTIDGQSQL